MLVRGTATEAEFQMQAPAALDEWDRWNANRDRQLEQSRSYAHVSREISGAEDLDSNGTWVDTPSYGPCWYPRVAADWAPYRDGRWSWLDWYGWSWVSYDPWGWAPYHYGRWFYNAGFGWGWWPGYGYRRHYWSPGLVAFVGWNSWGGIGWFPLAPYERYHPWYGSRYLGRDVSVVGAYRNAGIHNAVTGVDGRGFVNGRRGSAVSMNNASLVRGALAVTPGRESMRFSDREVGANSLPQSRNGTRFFSRGQTGRAQATPQGWGRFGGSWSARGGERGQIYRGNSGGYSRPAPSTSGRSYSQSAPSRSGGSTSRSAPSYSGGGGHSSGGGGSSHGGGRR
jgi:hypothetical protein